MAEIDMRDKLSSALALIIGDLKYRAQFVSPAPEKPYYIRGSYKKLQQVFINLNINAVQSVSATQEGSCVLSSVKCVGREKAFHAYKC